MMDITVRKAALNDLDAMVELMVQLLALEGDYAIDEARLRKGISMIIESDMSDFFVAEADGTVAGMCCLHRFISTVQGSFAGVIEDVVVSDSFKGMGIGSMMMNHMQKYAGQNGMTRLQLQVVKDNEPARSLYEKHGWEKTSYVGYRKYI